MSPQFWWYVARASGMVAAVLLVLTVVWGLLIPTKLIERRGLPPWLADLHRSLGGLTVAFVGVHLLSLVLDDFVAFSWSDLLIPFASSWRPGPVAWGVAAFWGLVVVEVSSLLRRRLGRRRWHLVHFLSYPVALTAIVHASLAGTDAGTVQYQVAAIGSVGAMAALLVFRILHRRPTPTSGVGRNSGPAAAGRRLASRGPREV